MITTEDIRQELVSAFRTIHGTYYPDTLVNYPNHAVVDIEHQVDPFVSVEIDLSQISRAALGERELRAPGTFKAYFYYKEGTGEAAARRYTDMLNEYMGMQQIGSIFYDVARPIPIQTFPGWIGISNTLHFEVVAPQGCE